MFMTVIPFFNNNLAVKAYMFYSQQSKNLMTGAQSVFALDGAISLPELDFINRVSLTALTSDAPLFIPIKYISLMSDLDNQCSADHSKIIFVVDTTVPLNPQYLDRIKFLKEKKHFKFAIQNVKDLTKSTMILSYMDFILINDSQRDINNFKIFLDFQFPHIKIIVSDIATADRYEQLKKGKFELYEGEFYRIPVTKGNNEISPLKVNYVQLITIANDDNFDITSVAKVVQQDIALTISLLHMVNSLGLNSEITSIKHAAAMLGQKELRKWITTAVVSMLCSDKPSELTRLSLIRAKFAETIAKQFEMAIHAPDLFMIGLFSVVDIALQMPMAQALASLRVPPLIFDALVFNKGKFVVVLDFIKAYEIADWQEVARLSIINNVNVDHISDVYLESLVWYSDLLASIYS